MERDTAPWKGDVYFADRREGWSVLWDSSCAACGATKPLKVFEMVIFLNPVSVLEQTHKALRVGIEAQAGAPQRRQVFH